ncbi:tubulin-tyrosine ligase family protein [Stylonychia lemnae]|uniref:Tubulin-tyrosine ligase family protein n=1 Tax=Stylonychia lemnae TaxID=5949 RepID=A0A078B9D3_STYLE|nr:tubulin-tyrosine ligase family protein [Stylonychia lemnae]|eukprot:CDW91004.1 tubulin-tyrosine ligase family protein [Stylonychia lemnae]
MVDNTQQTMFELNNILSKQKQKRNERTLNSLLTSNITQPKTLQTSRGKNDIYQNEIAYQQPTPPINIALNQLLKQEASLDQYSKKLLINNQHRHRRQQSLIQQSNSTHLSSKRQMQQKTLNNVNHFILHEENKHTESNEFKNGIKNAVTTDDENQQDICNFKTTDNQVFIPNIKASHFLDFDKTDRNLTEKSTTTDYTQVRVDASYNNSMLAYLLKRQIRGDVGIQSSDSRIKNEQNNFQLDLSQDQLQSFINQINETSKMNSTIQIGQLKEYKIGSTANNSKTNIGKFQKLNSDFQKYQQLILNGSQFTLKQVNPLKSTRVSVQISPNEMQVEELGCSQQNLLDFNNERNEHRFNQTDGLIHQNSQAHQNRNRAYIKSELYQHKNNFEMFQKQMLTRRELEKLILLNKLKRDGIQMGPFECIEKELLQISNSNQKLEQSNQKSKQQISQQQQQNIITLHNIQQSVIEQSQQLNGNKEGKRLTSKKFQQTGEHDSQMILKKMIQDQLHRNINHAYNMQSNFQLQGKRVQSTEDTRRQEKSTGRNIINSNIKNMANREGGEPLPQRAQTLKQKKHSESEIDSGLPQPVEVVKVKSKQYYVDHPPQQQPERTSQILLQSQKRHSQPKNLNFRINQQLFKNTLQKKPTNISSSKEESKREDPSSSLLDQEQISTSRTLNQQKLGQNFNNCIDIINMYLKLTIKNKNSLTQVDAIRFVKLTKIIRVHLNQMQKQSCNELNQFIKSREFISQSRLRIHSYLSETIFKSFSADVQLNFSKKEYVKFYVDSTGNNNVLVKNILKRRNWMQFQDSIKQNFDQASIIWTQWKKLKILDQQKAHQIYAKIDGNHHLTNKYFLLATMKQFYKSQDRDYRKIMPWTFKIELYEKNILQNKQFIKFKKSFLDQESQNPQNNLWILKPGENSNRGKGIVIMKDLKDILTFIEEQRGQKVVIQKYIQNPLLINKRKFDIRVFGLVQLMNKTEYRCYFYKEGYLRTSCREFTTDNLDNRFVHLTNDAIQKKSSDYGKFEMGNKISYDDFNQILLKEKGVDFYQEILPMIRNAVRDTLEAFATVLEDQNLQPFKNFNNFEGEEYDYLNSQEYSMNEIKYEMIFSKTIEFSKEVNLVEPSQ